MSSRNVWGRVGLGSAPAPDETKDTLQVGRQTHEERPDGATQLAHPAGREAADGAHGAARERLDQRDLFADARCSTSASMAASSCPRAAKATRRDARACSSRAGSPSAFSPLATGAMFLISMRGNYLYGYGIGQSEEKRLLFAWANVAADVWKAFGLVAITLLWRIAALAHRARSARSRGSSVCSPGSTARSASTCRIARRSPGSAKRSTQTIATPSAN